MNLGVGSSSSSNNSGSSSGGSGSGGSRGARPPSGQRLSKVQQEEMLRELMSSSAVQGQIPYW